MGIINNKIYSLYSTNKKYSTYLGWGSIGEKCERKLFYSFRRCAQNSEIDPRILRLFETGHREEDRLLKEIKDVGIEVSGQQSKCTSHKGHLMGFIDGILSGVEEYPDQRILLDVKTISSSNYKLLKKNGLKFQFPKYYAQAIGYMGNFKLKMGVFLFVVKDTDEIHEEWIKFNNTEFKKLNDKGKRIIFKEEMPDKISNLPMWWECKICQFHSLCHKNKLPDVNCRTCMYSTPIDGGKWGCNIGGNINPCEKHLYHPMFFSEHSKLISVGDKKATYERFKDFSTWEEKKGINKE